MKFEDFKNKKVLVLGAMTPKQLALAYRLEALIKKLVEQSLFADDQAVILRFDLAGRPAGVALKLSTGHYVINLNNSMIESHFDMIENDTLPHELAHVATHANNPHAQTHGKEWKSLCKLLGGTGDRCHNLPFQSLRVHTKYMYAGDNGMKVYVGGAVHRRLQSGAERIIEKIRIGSGHYTGVSGKGLGDDEYC